MSNTKLSSKEFRQLSCSDHRDWPRDFDFRMECAEQQEMVHTTDQRPPEISHQQVNRDE